jgi:hypothetical protein
MSEVQVPRVFICHASEDKDGFVREFAKRLRERGVDAWFDEWEMRPGDSLVRKIEQGLDACDVFVVILSLVSVSKPWVREELDAGFIKSIEDCTRLIPVFIAQCDVPRLLKSRLWVRIVDTSSYEMELASIVDAIFEREHRNKPPLGSAPRYARVPTAAIHGITETDSLVLKCAYERFIELKRTELTPERIFEHADLATVPPEVLLESLEALESHFLRFDRSIARGLDGIMLVRSEILGFERYATAYIANYLEIKYQIVACLVNTNARDSESIGTELGISPVLVAHVFNTLERIEACVVLSHEVSPVSFVTVTRPGLKRILTQRLFGE